MRHAMIAGLVLTLAACAQPTPRPAPRVEYVHVPYDTAVARTAAFFHMQHIPIQHMDTITGQIDSPLYQAFLRNAGTWALCEGPYYPWTTTIQIRFSVVLRNAGDSTGIQSTVDAFGAWYHNERIACRTTGIFEADLHVYLATPSAIAAQSS